MRFNDVRQHFKAGERDREQSKIEIIGLETGIIFIIINHGDHKRSRDNDVCTVTRRARHIITAATRKPNNRTIFSGRLAPAAVSLVDIIAYNISDRDDGSQHRMISHSPIVLYIIVFSHRRRTATAAIPLLSHPLRGIESGLFFSRIQTNEPDKITPTQNIVGLMVEKYLILFWPLFYVIAGIDFRYSNLF